MSLWGESPLFSENNELNRRIRQRRTNIGNTFQLHAFLPLRAVTEREREGERETDERIGKASLPINHRSLTRKKKLDITTFFTERRAEIRNAKSWKGLHLQTFSSPQHDHTPR